MNTKILVQWAGWGFGVFGLVYIPYGVLFNSNSRCSGGCYLYSVCFCYYLVVVEWLIILLGI